MLCSIIMNKLLNTAVCTFDVEAGEGTAERSLAIQQQQQRCIALSFITTYFSTRFRKPSARVLSIFKDDECNEKMGADYKMSAPV